MEIVIIRFKKMQMNNFKTLELPWFCISSNPSGKHLSRFLRSFDILVSIAVFLSLLWYNHAIVTVTVFNILEVYNQVLVPENDRILQDLVVFNIADLVVQLRSFVE